MSSRTLRAAVLLALVGGLTSMTVGGCSEDEGTASPTGDGGSDATPDANRPAPPEPDASTPKSCREKCEDAHPTGLPKDEAINSCWETSCSDPCIEERPGDGGSGDAAAPDAGACVSPVVTVSASCDECTKTFCCAEGDGCFQDQECAALNACYQQCVN